MGETHTTTGGIGKLTSLRTDEEGNSTEAKFPNPSSDKNWLYLALISFSHTFILTLAKRRAIWI